MLERWLSCCRPARPTELAETWEELADADFARSIRLDQSGPKKGPRFNFQAEIRDDGTRLSSADVDTGDDFDLTQLPQEATVMTPEVDLLFSSLAPKAAAKASVAFMSHVSMSEYSTFGDLNPTPAHGGKIAQGKVVNLSGAEAVQFNKDRQLYGVDEARLLLTCRTDLAAREYIAEQIKSGDVSELDAKLVVELKVICGLNS